MLLWSSLVVQQVVSSGPDVAAAASGAGCCATAEATPAVSRADARARPTRARCSDLVMMSSSPVEGPDYVSNESGLESVETALPRERGPQDTARGYCNQRRHVRTKCVGCGSVAGTGRTGPRRSQKAETTMAFAGTKITKTRTRRETTPRRRG